MEAMELLMRIPSRFWPISLAGIAVCTFLCWHYYPWVSGQSAFYTSDLSYYFEPLTRYVGTRINRGELPLWNPNLYCGMPQIAVVSPSFIYPPGLLFLAFPFSQALALYLVAHQMVAVIGGYLLARRMGLGWLSGAILGAGYGLGGYMFTATNNYTLIASAAWLPLMLYFLSMIKSDLSTANIRNCLLLSITVFLSITAGRPEIWLISMGIVAALTLLIFIHRSVESKSQNLLRAVASSLSVAAGIALAAPAVIPAYEWTKLSTRAHGMKTEFVMTWSGNWYDWISMMILPPLGDLSVINNHFYHAVGTRADALPYLGCGYVGPVILSLAIFSIFTNWKWRWWCLGLLAITIIFTAGSTTPIAPYLVDRLQFLSFLRYPIKLIVFPAFLLCVMASYGAQFVLDRKTPYWLMGTVALGWLVLAGVGLQLQLDEQVNPFFSTLPLITKGGIQAVFEMQALFARSFVGSALLGMTCVIISAMHRAGFGDARISGSALAALTCLTMVLCAVRFTPHSIEPDFYSKPSPVAEKLKELEPSVIPGLTHSSRTVFLYSEPLYYRVFVTETPEETERKALRYSRSVILPNQNMDFGIPCVGGYEAASKDAYWHIFQQVSFSSNLCDQVFYNAINAHVSDAPLAMFLSNAAGEYVVSQNRIRDNRGAVLDSKYFKVATTMPNENLIVFKHKQARPRAYFAPSVTWVNNWQDFAVGMMNPKTPKNLDDTYVEERQGEAHPQLNQGPAGSYKISATSDLPERVTFDVDAPVTGAGRSLFVLADTFYPGWSAQVDREDTPIYKVNAFFRGVFVPPGKHTIEFRYAPASFFGGVLAAAVVILVYALLFFLSSRKTSTVAD